MREVGQGFIGVVFGCAQIFPSSNDAAVACGYGDQADRSIGLDLHDRIYQASQRQTKASIPNASSRIAHAFGVLYTELPDLL